MATLALSAVGTALGGPVGGALGALVGQAIDQQLLGQGPRRGPRLGDLSIQTASYGTPIPRVYGSMRVAGSVVWADEIKESEQAVSGGKGASDVLRFSYTASFAVALSSRRAVRIGRVWADGQLLRGAAGDLKVGGTLRFHDGGEDQAVDPLIASIEGVAETPAFRGVALAVFEDLALGEYGNRIPMLTFELVADDGAISVGAILADGSDGAIVSGSSQTLVGYAAHGSDRREALVPLVREYGLRLGDDGGTIGDAGRVSIAAAACDVGCAADGERGATVERTRTPFADLPTGATLAYYDPARDYQSGLAQAGEAGGRTARTAELPAALSAEMARQLVEARLAGIWAEREQVTLRVSPQFAVLRPGDQVAGALAGGPWAISAVEIAGLVVTATLVRTGGRAEALPAVPGRSNAAADRIVGPTELVLLDLPDLGYGAGGPGLTLAATSASGWRAVAVDVTANEAPLAGMTMTRAALVGRATTVLGPGPATLIDDLASVTVTMVSADAWLTSCSDDALVMGTNLAAIGDELIQFGRVEPLGGGRFRLSRLLRGRRGSEWAIGGHAVGDRLVLIDPAVLREVALPSAMLGATIVATPSGLADGPAQAVTRVTGGEALRPPSPCHVSIEAAGGWLRLRWTRRSRAGWGWVDAIDAPVGEASELYRVRIEGTGGSAEWTTSGAALDLTATELAALGSGAAVVRIAQVGDRAASRDTVKTIII